MVHGDTPPTTSDGLPPVPGTEMDYRRFCFVPDPCCTRNDHIHADEALDPPAVTSRSRIFEAPPDGQSYALVETPIGLIYAYLSGIFSIEFSRDCLPGLSCEAVITFISLDTLGMDQGDWSLFVDDEEYVVHYFSIINENWFYGQMEPSPADPSRSIILFDPTVNDFELYLSGDTDHGLKGIKYTEAVRRSVTYLWDERKAYMSFTFTDGGGSIQIYVTGHEIAQPPSADAGSDILLSCEEEFIHLDASASTDYDSDISTYTWALINSAGRFRNYYGKTVDIPVGFEQGTTSTIRLDVFDSYALMDNDNLLVTIGEDNRPPVVDSIELPVSCLWPPNHEKVLFRLGRDIRTQAHDICSDDPVSVRIAAATSNQPESWWGEFVKTEDDVMFNDTTVCMRAERSLVSADNFERTYSILLEFKDSKGNTTQETVFVRVPVTWTETDKETCGDLSLLDWVETPEEEQECFGKELQYPPPPPPPSWCRSSIMDSGKGQACFPILMFLFAFIVFILIRRRK